jgi:hypothetical protein
MTASTSFLYLVVLLPALCDASAVTLGRITTLETRQLESNGVPSSSTFINRAYHSGTMDHEMVLRVLIASSDRDR